MFILSDEGRFLYVSESVSALLGLSQVYLLQTRKTYLKNANITPKIHMFFKIVIIGTHIFDYLYQEDQEELARYFNVNQNKFCGYSNSDESFKIIQLNARFRSTLLRKNNSQMKFSKWRVKIFIFIFIS